MKQIHLPVWFIALFALALAACGSAAEEMDELAETAVELERLPAEMAAASPSPASPTVTVAAETSQTPTETAVTLPTVDASPVDDEEATELMYTLSHDSADQAKAALARVVAANDARFIPVLIELFRARQIGLVRNLAINDYTQALEALSGQSFGTDWRRWVEWYGSTDLAPPAGFTSWKGRLLIPIDVRFAEFLRDDQPVTIRVEEIVWGGVVVDGIPALDNPAMLPAADADYIDPWDPVFGVAINDDARAYPLRILDWHEMANDVVGGVPVSLAYCTLCGAAIAYDGRAPDGSTYTFGSSGFLFRSNKLMYDRQTHTLWNQLTGEPVMGKLVNENVKLSLLPVVLTTWADWQAQHPDTRIVDVNTGFRRNYTPGAAYGNYFADAETMFPVWQRSDERAAKDQIYALTINDTPKAYPLDVLIAEQVVNDTLAGTNVTLIAARGAIQVDGVNQFIGRVTYRAGGEVRAYNRGEYTFTPGDDPDTVQDEAGRAWLVTEAALIGPDGLTAPRINGHLAYWFGWYAFFPNSLLYQP